MSKDNKKEERKDYYDTPYWPIFMVCIGVVFLLDNFGVLPRGTIEKIWPLFLIVPGVFMILNRNKK